MKNFAIIFIFLFSIVAKADDVILVDDVLLDRHLIEKKITPNEKFATHAANGLYVYQAQRWPHGIIPVEYAPGMTSAEKKMVLRACRTWGQGSSVECVRRRDQKDFLFITKEDNGCYSHVGVLPEDDPRDHRRVLNLGDGCWKELTILHELGHALGLMHEHQRPDRDKFIKINVDHVIPEKLFAFARFEYSDFLSEYDYRSIMHYSRLAFSVDKVAGKVTIEPVGNYKGVLGEATKLSAQDRKLIRQMYPQRVFQLRLSGT